MSCDWWRLLEHAGLWLVRALEDGWLLYRPEQEFLSLVGASSADWRLSKARQTLQF